MKNLLLLAVVSFLLFSCNNDKNTEQIKTTDISGNNALLYKDVTIRQEINLFPEENKDWKQSLVESGLIRKICDEAIAGKEVFDIDNGNILDALNLGYNMGKSIDTLMVENLETGDFDMQIKVNPIDFNQFKYLFFEENWIMDNELKGFSKNIKKYYVVREFINEYLRDTKPEEEIKLSKSLAFSVINNNTAKDYKLVAKNVISEFYFDQEYSSRIEGLNIENLQNIFLNNVLLGKVKTFSFNDLNEEISLADAKEIIGATTDTVQIEDINTGEVSTKIIENVAEPTSIIGLIFIENWLYDEETMMIKKDVIGIAPIWQNIRVSETGDVMESKMIPFVVRFDK